MVMIREEIPVVSEALEELKESEDSKKKKVLLPEDLGRKYLVDVGDGKMQIITDADIAGTTHDGYSN